MVSTSIEPFLVRFVSKYRDLPSPEVPEGPKILCFCTPVAIKNTESQKRWIMSSCPRMLENMEVYSFRKEGEPPFQEKALVFVSCKSCIAHLWRWKWTEIPREIFSKNMQKSEFSTSPQIWCLARLQAPGFQGVQISVDREPLTLARWKSLIPALSKRCARSQMNPPRIWNPVEACGGHMEAYGGMGKWSRMSSQQPFG